MRGPGVRYTVATDEDVESLESKWSLEYGALRLDSVSGHYETSIMDNLPTDLQDVFKLTESARIVYRNEYDLGDLFYTDTLPGTTVELLYNETSITTNDIESIKFVEILTGKALEKTPGQSAFIQVHRTRVFHDIVPPSSAFLDYLVERWPDVRTHMYGASMVESSIDGKSSMLSIRIISRIPQTLKLPESAEFDKTEVGIVQRQKRHLQDSEFKGLSAFLPAKDLNPFMIFFDQRLRPVHTQDASYKSTVDGKGSHLTFHTQIHAARQAAAGQNEQCTLATEYRLPKEYFFDAFELQKLYPNRTLLYGEQDLEAPVWQVSGWGSILFFDMQDMHDVEDLSIPFHARYYEPTEKAKARRTKIMAPQVFKACRQPDQAFTDNPWESFTIKSKVLGEDTYYRFLHNRGAASFEVSGALADIRHEEIVMWGTMLAILLGFCYIVLCMSPFRRKESLPVVMHQSIIVKE